MRINGRTVTVGLATLALVGVTGGGIAWATTGASGSTTSAESTLHCFGGAGMYGKYSPMTAISSYLGLPRAQLVNRMHSGASLAEIARAQGKTVSGLKSVMVSTMKRNLAADSDLTAAQRTAILSLMESHVDAMITGSYLGGMDADDMAEMMGGSYGRMMGGSYGGMMGGSGTWSGNGMMGR